MHEYPRQHIEETAKKLGFKDFIDPVDLVRFVKHHDAHVETRDQVYRSLEWLHGGTYLKFGDDESIWASGATVNVKHWIAEAKLKGDDYGLSTKVTVSWSSTSRDIALAYVALENYRHALDFAIKIEAFINGRPIIIAKQPDVKDGD